MALFRRSPRVFVVTGASAGVGRAVVREIVTSFPGSSIGLIARGIDGLLGAAKEVKDAGGTPLVLPLDVADAAAVEHAADEVEKQLGPIDVWINDAMVSVFAPALEITAEEFRRVTDVTYLGTVHGTLAALRRMKPRDRGTIVQVGSALAFRSIPLQSAYCAAKHAVTGFTESIRSELHHDRSRVHVTEVHLPAHNTPQFDWVRSRLPRQPQPVPPIFQPEVAARAIVWASQRRRRSVWVGTPTIKAILGDKFIPGILDRYLARAGWDTQMTDEPVARDRRDNLFDPLPGDHGAHGRFDARAKRFSPAAWLDRHRALLAAAMLGTIGIVARARAPR